MGERIVFAYIGDREQLLIAENNDGSLAITTTSVGGGRATIDLPSSEERRLYVALLKHLLGVEPD